MFKSALYPQASLLFFDGKNNIQFSLKYKPKYYRKVVQHESSPSKTRFHPKPKPISLLPKFKLLNILQTKNGKQIKNRV